MYYGYGYALIIVCATSHRASPVSSLKEDGMRSFVKELTRVDTQDDQVILSLLIIILYFRLLNLLFKYPLFYLL